MTGNTLQQQVEKNYIDSLLDVNTQQTVEDQAIESHAFNSKADDKKSTLSARHNNTIADDSLYQLVLVDGLKLAIPLSEISTIVDYSSSMIEDNILLHHDEKLTIVCLAALIRSKDKTMIADVDNKQLLLIQHRLIAIECHKILGIESIEKNLVCWRNESSQRRWLAGTVKQLGVAILDMAELQLIIDN